MKRIGQVAIYLCVILLLTGCGEKEEVQEKQEPKKGSVYFLNNKIETQDIYEEIANAYEEKTGVKVTVRSVSENSYQETLEAEMAGTDTPSLFMIQGIGNFARWEDSCDDISDSVLCEYLSDPTMAIWDSMGVYALPQSVEGYGIVYNEELIERYLNLDNRTTQIQSMSQIRDFATLREVVEDMTKHKKDLGIQGVFASMSMEEDNRLPWSKYLVGAVIAEEFEDNSDYDNAVLAALASPTIEFRDSDCYHSLVELYTTNSVTSKNYLKDKTIEDSLTELATGQAVMLQTGNWNWSRLEKIPGSVLNSEKVKMLPIYTGSKSDASRGICIGSENYLAVNNQISKEDREATLDFLQWLYGTAQGKEFVLERLGYIAPFNTFSEEEIPSNPLAREVVRYMNDEDWENVPWVSAAFPGGTFSDVVGENLMKMLDDKMDFATFAQKFREEWQKESVATTSIKGYNGM